MVKTSIINARSSPCATSSSELEDGSCGAGSAPITTLSSHSSGLDMSSSFLLVCGRHESASGPLCL